MKISKKLTEDQRLIFNMRYLQLVKEGQQLAFIRWKLSKEYGISQYTTLRYINEFRGVVEKANSEKELMNPKPKPPPVEVVRTFDDIHYSIMNAYRELMEAKGSIPHKHEVAEKIGITVGQLNVELRRMNADPKQDPTFRMLINASIEEALKLVKQGDKSMIMYILHNFVLPDYNMPTANTMPAFTMPKITPPKTGTNGV